MDRDTIINYVLNTPENTNPAILDGMLKELEGASGGGDFSTAEVTIVAGEGTTLYDVGFMMNFIYNDIYWMSDDVLHVLAGESAPIPIVVEGTTLTDFTAYSDDQETPVVNPTIAVIGDITYNSEEGTFLVTGDGTITITVPKTPK